MRLPSDAPEYDPAHPEALVEEQLYAKSAILIEATTGEVIFEKNADEMMYPASTTKIMTAMLGLQAGDMSATVTGPLRIVSDGLSGTIAGRVAIDRASWQLGRASTAADLPNIPTREINAPADIAPPRARARPWRFLIDAAGDNRQQPAHRLDAAAISPIGFLASPHRPCSR